eukprot:TRINITY_DN7106_c0_g1_i1.p1 TRINITY_DN7106_c0_g1~~TRINITY_DN7106_c0_g1_i1.p1  ORF type:complete len:1083 (-),score=302.36 TRINITY_DN7106_c0_g1_i1:48-3134(-)
MDERKQARFMWSEVSYLQKWWDDPNTSNSDRDRFSKHVSSGRLEIATGGWVMTEEAVAHHEQMMQVMQDGTAWIESTFGQQRRAFNLENRKGNNSFTPVASVGWACDPFGHNPVMAYVLKKCGFSNMFMNRIHYNYKKELAQSKSLEFFWRQNFDKTGEYDMVANVMPFYSYDIPHTCGPNPKVCALFDSNEIGRRTPWGDVVTPLNSQEIIHERAKMLAQQYREKAMLYRTNNLFVPLGFDFMYVSPGSLTGQIDFYQKLIDVINNDKEFNMKLQFSTLKEYTDAFMKSPFVFSKETKKVDLPVIRGDFLYYSDVRKDFWTGFYTSRVFWKELGRLAFATCKSAEILHSLSPIYLSEKENIKIESELTKARRAVSLFQHHDAVTGTANRITVADYGERIHESRWTSLDVSKQIIEKSLNHLLGKRGLKNSISLSQTESHVAFNHIRKSFVINAEKGSIILFNPLPYQRKEVISISVNSPSVSVFGNDGKKVLSQVVPKITKEEISTTEFSLFFEASLLPYGVSSYHIQSHGGEKSDVHSGSSSGECLSGKTMTFCFGKTGLLKSVEMKGKKLPVSESYVVYHSHSSGAYLFIPEREESLTVTNYVVVDGPLVKEVHAFSERPNAMHRTARIYLAGDEHFHSEIELTHEIHVTSGEVAMRLDSGMEHKHFATDLAGFQMAPRFYRAEQPKGSNFFPVVESAMWEDEKTRITLSTRNAFGFGCRPNGKNSQCDSIIDRFAPNDDARGLNDVLSDTIPVKLVKVLTFEASPKSDSGNPLLTHYGRESARRINNPILSFFQSSGYEKDLSQVLPYGLLKRSLPSSLTISSLHRTGDMLNGGKILDGSTPIGSLSKADEIALVISWIPTVLDISSSSNEVCIPEQPFTFRKVSEASSVSLKLVDKRTHVSFPLCAKHPYDIETFILGDSVSFSSEKVETLESLNKNPEENLEADQTQPSQPMQTGEEDEKDKENQSLGVPRGMVIWIIIYICMITLSIIFAKSGMSRARTLMILSMIFIFGNTIILFLSSKK